MNSMRNYMMPKSSENFNWTSHKKSTSIFDSLDFCVKQKDRT